MVLPLTNIVTQLLALPLTRRPLFPAMSMPVHVKDKKLIKALLEMKSAGYVLVMVMMGDDDNG